MADVVGKRAYNWNLKQTVMEDVDPHRCTRRHHRGIQHQVEAPKPYWKLNEDHHRARRRRPLKTARKHRSEKY